MSSAPLPMLPISPTTLATPPATLTPAQLLLPTSVLYAAPASAPPKHYGSFSAQRKVLDWTYHKVPTKERQLLQDEIVEKVLQSRVKECEEGRCCGSDRGGEAEERERAGRPLALFTAGGMGAGKGHTLRQFLLSGTLRLPTDFVWVDPDALARLLPERPQYLVANPRTVSTLLHPEASLLQEIVSGVTKEQERSLVVDGSLSDCGWFKGVMKEYEQAGYDIEILFVFAGEQTMIERAKRRAVKSGRVTDPEHIQRSRHKSPQCVARLALKEHVNRVRLVDNSDDHVLPRTVYDSKIDPHWRDDGYKLDVDGFVDGRLLQLGDGRVAVVSLGDSVEPALEGKAGEGMRVGDEGLERGVDEEAVMRRRALM